MKFFQRCTELGQTARFGTLTSICKEMCFFASYMDDGFARASNATNETNTQRRAWVECGLTVAQMEDRSQIRMEHI